MSERYAGREVEAGYNGNNLLPKVGHKVQWDAHKLREYKKCAKDPVYFAEKYFTILTADGDEELINLYDFQKESIRAYLTHRKQIVCTSRQIGKTTVATVIILHFALFNKGKRIALLANKGDQAREILDRIQMAFEMLPDFLKVGVREWNKGTVLLENRSKIVATATSGSAIRGKTQSLVYIDETAFVEDWERFSASVLPTLSSGKKSKTIFTSTPNGLNHFHKYWVNANRDHSDPNWNNFYAIEVPWYKVPGRDEQWKQEILATIDFDMDKFRVEYECEFQGSSGTLIAGSKLKQLVHRDPVLSHEDFHQFERAIEGRVYTLIADVARGKGLDYSAFHVIDITNMPYRQVAVYHSNIVSPTDYASVIHGVARVYNNASILVEVNDIGAQVSETIWMDFEYENVLCTMNAGRSGKRITNGGGKGVDYGIRTSTSVKSTGCSMLKMLVEQDQLIVNHHGTIQELSTFSQKGKSFEAEHGCHDDLVMGLVLFGWLTTQNYFKDLTEINTLYKLREKSDDELLEDLTPFGLIYDGLEDDDDDDFWNEKPRAASEDDFWGRELLTSDS